MLRIVLLRIARSPQYCQLTYLKSRQISFAPLPPKSDSTCLLTFSVDVPTPPIRRLDSEAVEGGMADGKRIMGSLASGLGFVYSFCYPTPTLKQKPAAWLVKKADT